METKVDRQPDGTIEVTLTIPWADIQKTYDKVVEDMIMDIELPGFRKGKAPREIALKHIDTSKVYEEAIRLIIPKVYSAAVTHEGIRPIVTPKIELKEAKEKSDWVVRALTCERPKVTLGEYKKAVTDSKASKSQKIWTPGTDQKPEDKEKEKKPSVDELLQAVYEHVTVTLPSLLVEHEVNRLLSDLIDQTKKLGLSVEQYLSSTGRTSESIRHEFEDQAKRTLTLEFALEDIADTESILVSDDDIDTVIKTAKSEEEKSNLQKERYYLASILRRQKTLDFLASL